MLQQAARRARTRPRKARDCKHGPEVCQRQVSNQRHRRASNESNGEVRGQMLAPNSTSGILKIERNLRVQSQHTAHI